jgi:hypothetical protein
MSTTSSIIKTDQKDVRIRLDHAMPKAHCEQNLLPTSDVSKISRSPSEISGRTEEKYRP